MPREEFAGECQISHPGCEISRRRPPIGASTPQARADRIRGDCPSPQRSEDEGEGGLPPTNGWFLDASGELSFKLDVEGCVSLPRSDAVSPRSDAVPTESSVPSSRGWLRRVLFAPGRVFFLAVLSLMELCGLPKIKQLSSSGRGGEDCPEGIR